MWQVKKLFIHYMKPCNDNKRVAANSTYKKFAVQWLNETLCFVSSLVLADSFRFQKPTNAKPETDSGQAITKSTMINNIKTE